MADKETNLRSKLTCYKLTQAFLEGTGAYQKVLKHCRYILPYTGKAQNIPELMSGNSSEKHVTEVFLLPKPEATRFRSSSSSSSIRTMPQMDTPGGAKVRNTDESSWAAFCMNLIHSITR